MQARAILLYYVRELRHVTRRRHELLSFTLAVAMHAVGHAAVALFAGGVAVALTRAWGLPAVRSSPLVGLFGEHAISDEALLLCGVGLAAVLVKGAAGVYATYVQGRVAGEVGGSLRLRLLDALLAVNRLRRPRHADQGKEGTASSAALAVSALTDRVHDVELGLKQGLLGGARAAAQIVPLAALLVWLSPRMAVVAALFLGVFGAALGRVRSSYQRDNRRAARERALLLEAADESVRHADLWVTYGAEEKARRNVGELGASLARAAARLEARAAALSGANEALGAAALVVAVGASRMGWLGHAADGGRLLGFAVAFFLMYRPLRELADARLALARAGAACGELEAAIDPARGPGAGADSQDREHANDPSSPARDWPLAELELRGLRLRRGASAPLSLRIEPGSIVAIEGPTGIGKTTLLRTLLGLDPAAGGEVLFDGAPLDRSPAGPAARPFAWVPQEAPLLADTLAANVSLGDGGSAEARAALDSLGAARLADELGAARLGAGGRPVSGGERQWIALARAIATRLPVLLLDEPTSGLDARAQGQVIDAIARLRGRRTVLLVTHRPEPLAIADVIVRLEPGAPLECAA
jgi:ABC-type multidrug transport system fused ATPase/permease subunit